MKETKKELRKFYKNVRINMTDKKEKDKLIFEKFIDSDLYKETDNFLVYVSSDIEADTLSFIRKAFYDKKTVAAPKCNAEDCTMTFYIIKSFDDLKEGAYGILEPHNCSDKIYCDENTLCIVPGLSFDKDGYRLGFGKGYYDRFLSDFPGKTVGFCYEECVCEKMVRDIYDKSVSFLITEKEIYHIK